MSDKDQPWFWIGGLGELDIGDVLSIEEYETLIGEPRQMLARGKGTMHSYWMSPYSERPKNVILHWIFNAWGEVVGVRRVE